MAVSSLLPKTVNLRGFAGQSAMMWAAQMGGILISVAAGIFITRALGPEGRGVYTWLLTLASVGASVGLCGLDISNRRFAGAHPHEIPALLKLNLWVISGFGGLCALLLGVLAMTQPASGQSLPLVVLAMVCVPLNAIPMAFGPVLVAQGKIGRTALMSFLPKVAMAVGAGLLLATAWVTLGNALFINFAAILLSAALPLWWLRKELVAPGHLKTGVYLRGIWRTGSAAYLAGLCFYLMQKVDVLLVGYFLGKEATGYYGVASNMVDIMITPALVIAGLLSARLASGNWAARRKILALTMGMIVSGCVFTYFVAPWVIPFLFGKAFEPSVPLLQMLCPAVVGLAWFALMQHSLMVTGRARHLPIPPLVGCVANVTLNIILLPRLGLIGACWASILAYGLASLCATMLMDEAQKHALSEAAKA